MENSLPCSFIPTLTNNENSLEDKNISFLPQLSRQDTLNSKKKNKKIQISLVKNKVNFDK